MNQSDLDIAINSIRDYQRQSEKTIGSISEKNDRLIKTIANIRTILERSLKNPSTLNSSVYEAINLCRANFTYMDYSTGKIKQDLPLTEHEKVLP